MDAQALLEEQGQLCGQIQDLAGRQAEWTAEDESTWATINARHDEITEQLADDRSRREVLARAEAVQEATARANADRTRSTDLVPVAGGDGAGALDVRTAGELRAEEQRAIAVQAWVRHQLGEEVTDEQREAAQATGVRIDARELQFQLFRGAYDRFRHDLMHRQQATTPDSAGGYTVPETMVTELEIALLYYSAVRQVADVMRTTGGNPMPWPTINDTANEGGIVDENAQITEEALVFAQVMFGSFKFSSLLVLLSQELIEDNAVGLVAELGRLLGERIGRRQNRSYTVGDGSAEAQGISLAPTGHTAASGTAIVGDDIIDLVHSVDPAYRIAGCYFQLNDQTLAAVRKLKDSQGAYIWQPGLQLGLPPTLYGYPYVINNHMPAIALSANPIVFGQMAKYKIRDVAQFRLRRLVERYADYDQEGFVAFHRSDGKLLDAGTGPIKALTMAAA